MWPSSPPGPPPQAHPHAIANPLRDEEQQSLPPPSYYSSVLQPTGGSNHQQEQPPPVDNKELETQPPRIGDRAPSLGPSITFPTDKPLLVVFLRYCGCPFAEQAFTTLTTFSTTHPSITCIAITQSPPSESDTWIISLGGLWSISTVIPDPSLSLYHSWGLHQNRSWYDWFVENLKVPITKPVNVTNLEHKPHGRYEGENKWQQGGAFGIDQDGFVRWAWVGRKVDDVVDFERGGVVEALFGREKQKKKKGGEGGDNKDEGGGNGQLM
ncbi:hypothetical protein QC761_705710 [Podospora bellae-mahoneyi]|uniref:Thioredoxin domain-containing protein n=1 Tax=Podospora bellae-mahoneyi TaxID=2093777 RepID=A0ABR0F848_9PEZI|nr:hypothetical protein QC761_705710 [Podospora bellae-mahoneyi]